MRFVWLLLAAVLLCSCAAETLPEETAAETVVRNYVHIKRLDNPNERSCYMIDYSQFEYIIERTSQILMVQIDSVDELYYTGSYYFDYTAEILKIYHDTSGSLEVGEKIPIHTTEGTMKAADAAEMVKYHLTYKGQKVLTDTYTDNDYIISSTWNAVPMEAGGTYIVYLSSENLLRYGYYTECGYSHLYEIVGEEIYTGHDRILSDMKLGDVEETIAEQLQSRKGRVEEIGYDLYSKEVIDVYSGEPPITYPCEPRRILPYTEPDNIDMTAWRKIAQERITAIGDAHQSMEPLGPLAAWSEISYLYGYPMYSYDTGRVSAVAYDFTDKNGESGMMILNTDDLTPDTFAQGESVVKQFYAIPPAESEFLDVTGDVYLFYEGAFTEGYGIYQDDGTLDIFSMHPILEGTADENSVLRDWIFPG